MQRGANTLIIAALSEFKVKVKTQVNLTESDVVRM